MAALLVVAVLAAISHSEAVKANSVSFASEYRHPPNGICVDYTIKQDVTSTNYIWDLEKFTSNFDTIEFLTELARKDSKTVYHPVSSNPKNETKTYEVSATFCSPKKANYGKDKIVLLATHGLGYDRRYWASAWKPKDYSFVDFALDKGYSVFFYDRLGVGKSQIVSGYVNQGSIQLALLERLVELVRAGKYTGSIGKPKNIVLVGHSFGSFLSNAVISDQRNLVDGVVLTGIAYANATDLATADSGWGLEAFAARIAKFQDKKWSNRDTGYLNFGDIYGHVNGFFKAPNYDIPTVEYAQAIAQPFAALEFVSTKLFNLNASAFKGPVMVTAGENDLLLCGGECKSTFSSGVAEQTFKSSKDLNLYVHPGAGHGVNFGFNATVFYGKITAFLDKNF
ncbi:alpha/beta-hydrolase [Mytilinidion resinicola]|uniref:Alpha/beta-hydrolase n=1 Tax=Mytilinidion resinicola TaxID=574789 RepID=A0A6A6Z747_9PEZI|nr:alpha/beta-hydrolase [Mytilinidion resinicola]KAF2816638.1 alpha/beta-hydrolase [Mytilinidion resinicola]